MSVNTALPRPRHRSAHDSTWPVGRNLMIVASRRAE